MATLEKLGLDPSWQLTTNGAAVPLVAHPAAPAFGPLGPAAQKAMRLEGPSTLALALVGAGTLVLYRGIQQRLSGHTPATAAAPRPVKPRRRAA
jgi:hypothetical protein